ncbi:type II toxin-antitoxin system RelE/ParE family toxin [Nostoc sp.]|uniref:type II toxin-antitoxin system RelE/ParE family toxin n=1 Tax=Nostoc sp. TaxID=1180 RepID=UPI002FFC2B6E
MYNAESSAFNLGESLRFQFKKNKLEALYTQEKDAHKYPGVVDDFFEVMAIIDAAVDERDLYAYKGLRFEKLSGKRGKKGQRSLRLNNQWRLIVTVNEDEQGNYLTIIDIEDYH